MERGEHAEITILPAIEYPTEDQINYFLMKAAFLDEVFEAGGMDAEQAAFERGLTLGRIGMGQMFEHHPQLPFDDAS